MPDAGPATPLMAATTDDLDAQCRGIGTSPRAAYHTAPAAGTDAFAEVPVARATLRDGDGPAVRQASEAP